MGVLHEKVPNVLSHDNDFSQNVAQLFTYFKHWKGQVFSWHILQ